MENNNINRRDFVKIVGISTAATAVAAYGCKSNVTSENGVASSVPTGQMTYRTFPGVVDDKVSLLGYGCMRWPTLESPDGTGNVINQEEVNRLVDYAIEHGVNYFDTSPVYVQGWSEKSTGIALSRHQRDSYLIATKLSNFGDTTLQAGIDMYRKSFKDLQVDYIDYYLLHNIGDIAAFNRRFVDNGMLDFLLAEREAGHIRHLGWSFHGSKEGFNDILATHETYHWDFVQIQLNYSDWLESSGRNVEAVYLYDELSKRNIPSVIMEPLLGGRLSNLPTHVYNTLKERNPEASAASWAFRFAGSLEHILTVLSGMTYMEHLQDNLRTYSPLVPVTDEEKEFLFEVADMMKQYPIIQCNDCKYCMPCPYGIDIPGVLLHYNKCVNEGNIVNSSDDDNYKKARMAFLVGYDRSVPKLRQASHCSGCNQCSEHCPQRLNIPQELEKIDEYVEALKQQTI